MRKLPHLAAPRCSCGSHGELRRCAANGGVAWRCPQCLKALSKWIPHESLLEAGVDIAALPEWDAAPDKQTVLL